MKFKHILSKLVQFILNPHLVVCLVVAWFITNGWSYILFGFGTYYKISWMIAISSAYLAFLWLPISPEKIATVAIAIILLKRLFPNDQKTLGVLKSMKRKLKEKLSTKSE